jgi:hypothetical protein
MPRRVPALVVALLLLSAPVAAALTAPSTQGPSAASPPDSPLRAQSDVAPQNTTNVLLLDEVGASNVTEPRATLTAELDMQQRALQSRFVEYTVEERFRKAETREDRREILLNATEQVAKTTRRLYERERTARAAYLAGSISAERYLTALGYLQARAENQQRVLDTVHRLSRPGSPIRDRTEHLGSRLAVFQGPVRGHAAAAVRSDTRPRSLYLAASENGVVLSAFERDDGVYVRETVRTDRLDDAKPSEGLTTGVVENQIMAESYPWLMNETTGINTLVPRGGDAWLVALDHPHGHVATWIDASTRQVYHETQRKFLEYYPAGPTEQTLASDLILTVNRTYAGGPLQVTLTNRTGEPLDGEVRIDGERVGTTGGDGSLWTLGRPGTFEVTVVHEDQRVRMTVTAVGDE